MDTLEFPIGVYLECRRDSGYNSVMAKILGIGGVFFKAKDPGQLSAWYAKWLGLDVKDWGGVVFLSKGLPASAYAIWSTFEARTRYFSPSKKPFMVNFMVDDLDAMLKRIARSGGEVMPRRGESEFGRFGWFVDPDGNKVELWERPRPKRSPRKS
jgi:predicted enzyme related to lactoylglutathione lyase